jgi:ribosomal protein S14
MMKAKEEGRDYTPPKGRQPTKFYNRCWTSWKVRSYMRDFWVSRQAFRRYAREWIIMWLRKSSR